MQTKLKGFSYTITGGVLRFAPQESFKACSDLAKLIINDEIKPESYNELEIPYPTVEGLELVASAIADTNPRFKTLWINNTNKLNSAAFSNAVAPLLEKTALLWIRKFNGNDAEVPEGVRAELTEKLDLYRGILKIFDDEIASGTKNTSLSQFFAEANEKDQRRINLILPALENAVLMNRNIDSAALPRFIDRLKGRNGFHGNGVSPQTSVGLYDAVHIPGDHRDVTMPR